MPASQWRSVGNEDDASPAKTVVDESPSRNVDAAISLGSFGSSIATRPSTVTVEPCSSMRSMTDNPSMSYGRTPNATATGTAESFSISTITRSRPPSAAVALIA